MPIQGRAVFWCLSDSLLFDKEQSTMFPPGHCCVLWEKGSLLSFALHATQSFQNIFSSSLTRARGVSSVPDVHSSKKDKLVEDCEGLSFTFATNIELSHCSCEGRHFFFTKRKKSPVNIFAGTPQSGWVEPLEEGEGSISLWSCVMQSSGMSAMTACASVRDRIHSSSWMKSGLRDCAL